MKRIQQQSRRTKAATPLWVILPVSILTFGIVSATSAQEEGQAEVDQELIGPPPPVVPPFFEQAGDSGQDLEQEMIKLFHTVERKMEQVDLQLTQAGTGVVPLEAPADSGLDDLLRSAMQASQDLSQDIDRMLEIAQQMTEMQQSQGGGQGQAGQPQPGQEGDSPIDSRQQGGQQDREQTPEGPQDQGQQEGQQQGQEGQEGPDGQDQEGQDKQDQPDGDNPDGQNPDGYGDNPESGSNLPGEEQGGRPANSSGQSNDTERWGELPVRVREVFRNQGREDLPVQYRDWIDAYYRRLSKTDR